jgi:serine/threonine-protein kinase
LGLTEVLRIGRQIAAGLAAAHAQGLVHRDIKPANILLAEGTERLQITDFGLARTADDASLTRTGVIAGTPQYMSPEQARGEAVEMRSDLFSLGSVMYAMCTGHPPFRAETSYGVIQRINDDQPRPIQEVNAAMPAWLNTVVLRLLAKEPSQRFDSAERVAELLEQCLAHVQQPALAPLPPECRQSARRSKWPLAAAALALLLVAIIAGLLMRNRDDEPVPDGNSAPTSTAQSSKESARPWSDGLHERIQELSRDVEDLEQAAHML